MGIKPFGPHTIDDIAERLEELLVQTDNVPSSSYSDRLRDEVLDLIEKATDIMQFDAEGKNQVGQALGLLYDGNARLALVKLRIAIDVHRAG